MSMFFSRDTRVLLKQGANVWEIPVLDGFSFSQATNSSEITLNEAINATTGKSRRSRQMFNDSLAPAEWSFSTYVRPVKGVPDTTKGWLIDGANNDVHAVEEALWANFAANNAWRASAVLTKTFASGGASGATTVTLNNVSDLSVGDPVSGTGIAANTEIASEGINTDTNTITLTNATGSQVSGNLTFISDGAWSGGLVNNTSNCTINWNASEVAELGTFELYFVMGKAGAEQVYKCDGAVVNEATVDFEVDGIATINWSGFASLISDQGTTVPTTTITEKIIDTDNFIRNRLTTLALTANPYSHATFPGVNSNGVYNLTLTGGSLTFSNNITFLTPDDLGKVNIPLGHIAGTRVIGGSITCYLNDATGGSADLFKALIESTSKTVNSFNMVFTIGGAAAGPRLVATMPRCHLEIPTHSIDDAISVETTFHALPLDIDPNTTTADYEAKLQYNSV